MKTFPRIALLGAALGVGGRTPGTAKAPELLVKHGILERLQRCADEVLDCGIVKQGHPSPGGDPRCLYLNTVADFCTRLCKHLRPVFEHGYRTLVVGGDHAISIGSIAAAAGHLGASGKLGLIWIDAHPDINTPDMSLSGCIHGMSVAASLGLGPDRLTRIGGLTPKLEKQNIVYIGLRRYEPPEELPWLRQLGIKYFDMDEVRRRGIEAVCNEAADYLLPQCERYLVSFDVDVCDPSSIPAVNTPVPGGLSPAEASCALQILCRDQKLLGLELVEYNPQLDPGLKVLEECLRFIEAAFGGWTRAAVMAAGERAKGQLY